MLVVSIKAANASVNDTARRDDLVCDEVNIYVVASPQCVIKGPATLKVMIRLRTWSFYRLNSYIPVLKETSTFAIMLSIMLSNMVDKPCHPESVVSMCLFINLVSGDVARQAPWLWEGTKTSNERRTPGSSSQEKTLVFVSVVLIPWFD